MLPQKWKFKTIDMCNGELCAFITKTDDITDCFNEACCNKMANSLKKSDHRYDAFATASQAFSQYSEKKGNPPSPS